MFAKLHQKMRLGGKRFVIAGRGAGADFIASCPKTSKHGVASKPIGIAFKPKFRPHHGVHEHRPGKEETVDGGGEWAKDPTEREELEENFCCLKM